MTIQKPPLRHLGNDTADALVLYLQDDGPTEARPHISCNPRCHDFDAGVVAGRIPEILKEERERLRQLIYAEPWHPMAGNGIGIRANRVLHLLDDPKCACAEHREMDR